MGGDIVWIKINISNNFGTAAVFMDALKLESSKNVNRLINLQQTERILNNYFYPYLMEPGHDNITALKSVKKVIEENQRYKGIIAIYFDEKYKDNQSSDHCTRTFASSI
jgi:bacillopeptidase F (M6 metalloprotease family)